eukprot:5288845-Ditylum_brightwellii.AAC.4
MATRSKKKRSKETSLFSDIPTHIHFDSGGCSAIMEGLLEKTMPTTTQLLPDTPYPFESPAPEMVSTPQASKASASSKKNNPSASTASGILSLAPQCHYHPLLEVEAVVHCQVEEEVHEEVEEDQVEEEVQEETEEGHQEAVVQEKEEVVLHPPPPTPGRRRRWCSTATTRGATCSSHTSLVRSSKHH